MDDNFQRAVEHAKQALAEPTRVKNTEQEIGAMTPEDFKQTFKLERAMPIGGRTEYSVQDPLNGKKYSILINLDGRITTNLDPRSFPFREHMEEAVRLLSERYKQTGSVVSPEEIQPLFAVAIAHGREQPASAPRPIGQSRQGGR